LVNVSKFHSITQDIINNNNNKKKEES